MFEKLALRKVKLLIRSGSDILVDQDGTLPTLMLGSNEQPIRMLSEITENIRKQVAIHVRRFKKVQEKIRVDKAKSVETYFVYEIEIMGVLSQGRSLHHVRWHQEWMNDLGFGSKLHWVNQDSFHSLAGCDVDRKILESFEIIFSLNAPHRQTNFFEHQGRLFRQ